MILFALFICFFRVAASAQGDITLTGIECALTSELEHLQEQNDANEQLERTADDDLSHIERRFSELSLAIYHQDYENFFFLSYYSSQVAQLNNYFFSNNLPYYRMGQKVQREITRQQALRKALTLAQSRHTSPETRAQLTRCLALNEQLLALYTARQVKINAQKARFVRLSGRITALDIYANGKAVAKDESHYEDNIGPEQMISTLFEDEAAEGSADEPEQKASAALTGVEEERLTPADFVTEDLPSAVLARRLVQQLIDPYSITTSLDQPENGYSYGAQLRQFPQRFAAQYFPKAGNPSLETVREIIAFSFSLVACVLGAIMVRAICSSVRRSIG